MPSDESIAAIRAVLMAATPWARRRALALACYDAVWESDGEADAGAR
jgi:hypothetical protein